MCYFDFSVIIINFANAKTIFPIKSIAMRKILLTLAAAAALSAAAQPGPGFMPQIQLPECGWTNIDYVGDGLEGHKLDIFVPDSVGGPYKPIVVIYGSAWFANNAKDIATASMAKPLLDQGFAVVSINHRASTEAQFPAQIHDVKAALRFVRGNAEKYNLDPSFVGITGFSSGGHLSSLAGVSNGNADLEGSLGAFTSQSSDVDAVVDWFGPVDMTRMNNCETVNGPESPEAVLIGGNPADKMDMIAAISPITYVDPSDARFMVIHGDADPVVPYCQSVYFSDALAKAGVLEEFVTVPGGNHGPVTFNDDTFLRMARFFSRQSALKAERDKGAATALRPKDAIYSQSPKTFTYTSNPIVSDKFTADPAPLVYDGKLYLYVGHDEFYEGQDTAGGGNEFNITEWLCYSTPDMVNWTDHGPVLMPTDYKWAERAAWAAQVVEKDGKFYYYTTSIGKEPFNGYCVGVAVADNPFGPFVDPIGRPLVEDKMTDNGTRGWWNDIDPTVLIDGDDAWLCWGNGTCFLAKLKPNMVEIDGDIQVVDVPKYIEGPWLYKHGDLYYLIYASMGNRAEAIDYATAPSMAGPWTHRGQVTGCPDGGFTIHPGVIDFNGKTYLFYHNAAQTINGIPGATGRRSVCVDELQFNPDGTIQFVKQTSR